MSRKLMIWVILPITAVMLWGCPKKPPMTTDDDIAVDTTSVTPPPPAATEVVEEPDTAPNDVQEEALPDDVVELNRVLRERGLIDDVYFDYDKAELRSTATEQLARNARWLNENPQFAARIEGHCDERGTNEYNLALGERRSNVAKDYLSSLGVAGTRLTTITYGEERPVCTQESEACWQRNRRAHFVVMRR